MTAESELKAQSSANPSSNNGLLAETGWTMQDGSLLMGQELNLHTYLWLPYHKTLLQGANDQDRNKKKCWPARIPRDAASEKVTSRFLELIHQSKHLPSENLVFIPKEDRSCAYDHTVKLLLVPVD